MAQGAETSRTSGFALALLFATGLIELIVVGFAGMGFDEVADASPFGRTGTVIAVAVIAVVSLAGVVVALRGAHATARMVTAVVLFVAVGVVAVMALFFLIAGGAPIIFAILLVLTAVSIGMIGRAVLQAERR